MQAILEITTQTESPLKKIVADEIILEAVDSAFQTLGAKGSQAIYRVLCRRYGLKKEDIPHNIDVFAKALEIIFGKAAFLIEIRIMQLLHAKMPEFKLPSDA